ncbi:unnamed protein product [Aphanomyces euteiches]|uniref:Uncharacterized protein n=1 Tax=Aphanomyces euteiches TaxID=100861 RepID=A0A6G0WS63_9STRA|nr:hypothetical protein Ae201684_012273 [Aphanomyces euteiches]KAH9132253.1 hypothetical protein AeRB84_021295 [Aphanomyces euteiches]KAH9135763.1 hypothetical protein AeRB84_018914 [Aphanomyces euteiches]KAH9137069.1 hypothetical protein AeRB84_018025 [Aphanomyces euteiches]KAH9155558.1 hypothetical protein AeRB84_002463 [Aphanomyces euteiches]
MKHFVSLNLQNVPEQPLQRWHTATLLGHPQARKLCKEWLTQQLYHNINNCFEVFSCTRMNEEFYGIDVDVFDEGLKCTEMMQQIWPGTMPSCKHFFQHHTASLIFLDPTRISTETTENTRLYRKITDEGVFFNILQGNFVEADRFVVVLRQIENDEEFNSEPYRQRHNMTWLDIRPLSETHVVFSAVSQSSQFFREGQGFVILGEQARTWNIDLTGVPNEKKLDYFRSQHIHQEYKGYSEWRQRIQQVITKTCSTKVAPMSC